jgi:MoxR-like ATPase
MLFEVLSDFQVSIPELGTVRARQELLVFLTSNATPELSDALKRRCPYLHLDAISRTPPVLLKDHRGIEHASAELDLVSSAGKETPP